MVRTLLVVKKQQIKLVKSLVYSLFAYIRHLRFSEKVLNVICKSRFLLQYVNIVEPNKYVEFWRETIT